LKKPGKLTEGEIKTIQSHSVVGEKILSDVGLPDEILKCVRHHHESLDGKGYPDGLKGEDIPIGARIIKVVDAFGAMVSSRPYREPLSFDGALSELRLGAGRDFDSRVIDAFSGAIAEEKNHSLCRRLSRDPRTANIPIIVISTAGSIDDEIAILESGADDYLPKPFNLRELVARINAHLRRIDHEKDVNPLTGLSGTSCIESDILKRMNDPCKKFGMIRIDLDNFKAFNDVYGLLHGDEVLKLVAEILRETIKTSGNENDFIGHIGGDNFVVITSPDNVDMLSKQITSEFDRRIHSCYHKDDVQRGYILRDKERHSLLTMSTECATNRDRDIYNYQDFERVANEVKVYAKK